MFYLGLNISFLFSAWKLIIFDTWCGLTILTSIFVSSYYHSTRSVGVNLNRISMILDGQMR